MNHRLYDKLSNSNPQLMREIKGRFKPAQIGLSISGSLLIQGLVLLSFLTKLPISTSNNRNPYCYPSVMYSREDRWVYDRSLDCLKDSSGNLLIGWPLWWEHICQTLSAIAIIALV
ncbi:MAG: hypothetical protein EYR95_16870, partial [Phormidium sp. SL48-SHIP]